jgi:hypothetical protein
MEGDERVIIPLGLPLGLCFVALITVLQDKQALTYLALAVTKLLIAVEAEFKALALFHFGRQRPLDLEAFDGHSPCGQGE